MTIVHHMQLSKRPAETVELVADVTSLVIPYRQAAFSYGVGDVVRVNDPRFADRVFIADRAGTSRIWDPEWSRDAQVVDGGVAWRPAELGDAGVPTVSSVVWSSSSSTLNFGTASESRMVVRNTIDGGVLGAYYDVTAVVTFSTGVVRVLAWRVRIV